MASVSEHYDAHLGPIYDWMLGGFDAVKDAARDDLRSAGIVDGAGRLAIDLGSGLWQHSIALAEAGYTVIAIDASAPILNKLRHRAGGVFAIRCIHDDLLNVGQHCGAGAEVITCMGDTLTHLPSLTAVEQLFESIAGILTSDGVFIATFRDYSVVPPSDAARFIPVRRDDNRILTCVLEYAERHVLVHDLLHERTADGWNFRVSGYAKLRLSPSWLRALSNRLGLVATVDAARNGMVRLTVRGTPCAHSD